MHFFIALCLIAATSADTLGYNYQPVRLSENRFSYSAGSEGNSHESSSNIAPSVAYQNNIPSATNEAESFVPQAELEKEFFTYSTNDDDFNDPAATNQYENSVKKGLRVIFIKGPENNGLENAAVSFVKHTNDQKTNIYVLQKEADIKNLANKLNIVSKSINNKPEVHFVKYLTPEDASNAQTIIQGQYDALGGSTHSHGDNVATVLDFASKPSASQDNYNIEAANSAASNKIKSLSSSYLSPNPVVEDPSNTYLPASVLRLFRL